MLLSSIIIQSVLTVVAMVSAWQHWSNIMECTAMLIPCTALTTYYSATGLQPRQKSRLWWICFSGLLPMLFLTMAAYGVQHQGVWAGGMIICLGLIVVMARMDQKRTT